MFDIFLIFGFALLVIDILTQSIDFLSYLNFKFDCSNILYLTTVILVEIILVTDVVVRIVLLCYKVG